MDVASDTEHYVVDDDAIISYEGPAAPPQQGPAPTTYDVSPLKSYTSTP
jgi:hypothetical protein